MRDRFRGKTWIYWAQFTILGALGSFSVVLGTAFWTEALRDAVGRPRPQAGPPMLIIGSVLLIVATLAAFNIYGRIAPMIRCFRNGFECNLTGASSLEGGLPQHGLIWLAWRILSLEGFRSQRMRVLWSEFSGAEVTGTPMAYVLRLSGAFRNVKTGRVSNWVEFMQFSLVDRPQEVADTLNQFACELKCQTELPEWP